MAELSSAQRKNMPASDFAIPPDQYPIKVHGKPDRQHAADALARVKANGTAAEQAQVRRAVCKLFPDFPECQTPGAQVDQQVNGGK